MVVEVYLVDTGRDDGVRLPIQDEALPVKEKSLKLGLFSSPDRGTTKSTAYLNFSLPTHYQVDLTRYLCAIPLNGGLRARRIDLFESRTMVKHPFL